MLQSIDKKNRVVIYLLFLLILSTTKAKFSDSQKKYSLKIDKIAVSGLTNIKNLKIKNELSNIFYKNIFLLNKEEINKIISKHNIIDEYNITKIYPSTLNIEIKPTKFMAKMTNSNELIVGSNGKLISNVQDNTILPYIFGEFNSNEFLRFKQSVERSRFNFEEFKAVYFFTSYRWDILTYDGILIKLPQSNVLESLNMAYKTIGSPLFKGTSVIDLRIKNQLITK